MQEGIVECVININHNSNQGFIEGLVGRINKTGAHVAHYDRGVDAQRTVLTILSYVRHIPKVLDIIYASCSVSQDINDYKGNHPSIGIVDVVPFIPIKNITRKELKILVDHWAQVVAGQYKVPIIYYGGMSWSPDQKDLSQIRKGGIRSATKRIKNGSLHVDQGPNSPNPTLGLSCWAVRELMLAYNVSLGTEDLQAINYVAKQLRELRQNYPPLQNVKVLGWLTPFYNCGQISANLYDIQKMTLESFYDLVNTIASDSGIEVIGSELIGMSPRVGFTAHAENHPLNALVDKLGLAKHVDFLLEERLLDRAIEKYEQTHTSSTI